MKLVLFVNPFHRMFVIDDINLKYPHALVERVPVRMIRLKIQNASLADLHSLEHRICWSYSIHCASYLASRH